MGNKPDIHSLRPGLALRLLGFILLLCVMVSGGCFPAPKIPLDTLFYPATADGRADNLLVLLRGLGDTNAVFEQEGVIDQIRQRRLPFDIVAPDTHFGYFKAHTLEKRLKADVIDPARLQGYRQIWMAGFSLGGLGTLFYLRSYPHDLDGVILVSPFLGWNDIIEEIKDAGGVKSWQQVTKDPDDWSRLLWSWIKEYAAAPQNYPPIYLGYGSNDWLANDGPPLLATVLPAQRVFSVPGNHTISTFKTIFTRELDLLQARFPAAPPYTATRGK